jgi:hypothetical protein
VSNIIATMPKLVGLKKCLPLVRTRNLLAMVTAAAAIARPVEFVRSRRQSDSPEIRALRGSNAGSFQSRVHAYCVSSAAVNIAAARPPEISKSSRNIPYASSAARMDIW